MPDGTVPSSMEAMRAALAAARASLERQLRASHSDAAEDALRQVKSAMRLLPAERIRDIPDIEWTDAEPSRAHNSSVTPDASATPLSSLIPDPLIPESSAPQAANVPALMLASETDDLTRIRGIDDVLAKRLAALGIQRYAQIAAWQPDDVRVIADAMGLGRRFLAMGIVDQAIQLEHAQTATRASATERPATPTVAGLQSVAVWEPKSISDVTVPDSRAALVRMPLAWKPLDGETLRSVLSIIRTKRQMNVIIRLSDVAPALTQPIYIATDHDAAVELPRWRTGVLVPFVEAREAPDLLALTRTQAGSRVASGVSGPVQAMPSPRTSHVQAAEAIQTAQAFRAESAQAQVSQAAHAIAAFHAAVAASAPVAPAAAQPLHEQAASRIDDLEAELDHLAHVNAPQGRGSPERIDQGDGRTQGQSHVRIAEPPADLASQVFGSRDDVPEADVKIVVGARAKAPLLAPLPELPLTARPHGSGPNGLSRRAGAAISEVRHGYGPGNGPVDEAAVVIVRRSSPEPIAPGLAFYAKKNDQPSSGPVRRFMRALAGG